MVALAALAAAIIAFYPGLRALSRSDAALQAAVASGPATSVDPAALSASDAAPPAQSRLTPPALSPEAKAAQSRLAAAMASPAPAADGLSEIARAAGAPSGRSRLGGPAGDAQTGALAYAGALLEPAAQDLCARARAQLREGAAASARLLLTRAAREGSAEALTLLGVSYDAKALAELGAQGVKGDAEKARAYYRKAVAAGSQEARDRLSGL